MHPWSLFTSAYEGTLCKGNPELTRLRHGLLKDPNAAVLLPPGPPLPRGSAPRGSLPGESSCFCADVGLVLTLGKERAESTTESSQRLLGSPVQVQSTQQENICLQGVLWRTCNAWIIFVCSSAAKWTDPNPARSKVRCWILFWLDTLPLTTALSHPGGILCSADGRAAAQRPGKLCYEGPLCAVVRLGSAPHLEASDPVCLCVPSFMRGTGVELGSKYRC